MKTLLAAICLICTFAAQAEVYKWTDKNGVVHYSDTKPQDETIEVKEFFGSPIKINDKGLVVQVDEKSVAKVDVPPKTVAVPERKPEVTLSSLLADARKYIYGLLNGNPETSPVVKPQASLPLPEASLVISNDNMGEVLEQIAQEKKIQLEKEEALAKPSVEIFTTPWCGYCKKAIVYLELNKINYKEYNVSADASAALRQQMLGGGSGVPFAVINGEKIRGWNKQAYARALGL